MQKLIHWKHNWSPKTWRGLNTRQEPDVLCMLGGIFFFIPMAFIQIEQLTKLFLYFSINIQLQSCYTYIPTIQQVVHSCYGCQKSSMHNCYTSVIMAMMIILKTTRINTHSYCTKNMFKFNVLFFSPLFINSWL